MVKTANRDVVCNARERNITVKWMKKLIELDCFKWESAPALYNGMLHPFSLRHC